MTLPWPKPRPTLRFRRGLRSGFGNESLRDLVAINSGARVAGRLKGAHITFPQVTVGGTENLLMAATLAEGETVLAADTTVVLDGQILGKPEDAADALAVAICHATTTATARATVRLRAAG